MGKKEVKFRGCYRKDRYERLSEEARHSGKGHDKFVISMHGRNFTGSTSSQMQPGLIPGFSPLSPQEQT